METFYLDGQIPCVPCIRNPCIETFGSYGLISNDCVVDLCCFDNNLFVDTYNVDNRMNTE